MKAYAKINLSLDILNKRKDGFHNLNSVMRQIDLSDELEFSELDEVIVESPIKEDIVLKTALKLKQLFSVKKGIKIKIKKNIPISSGLGGGSSDAALTLLVLNKLWDLGLKTDYLVKIAADLGADIPFFLYNKCSFVSGTGDEVVPMQGTEMNILLINPGYAISTKEAYNQLDKKEHGKKKNSLKLKNKKEIKEIASLLHNDFIAIQKQDVLDIIDEIKKNGALNASITGKGPTVFGIFKNRKKAQQAYEALKNQYPFVYLTRTLT